MSVSDLGNLWERQFMHELKEKRRKLILSANACKPDGEYRAQMMRIVAMYDRAIAAAPTPPGAAPAQGVEP